MAFDNYYPNRKDNRRIYIGRTSKKFDSHCRNHGLCSYCVSNRLINQTKTLIKANEQLKEYYDYRNNE